VLAGGDDYELAFTAPPAARAKIEALAAPLGLALTRVGAIEAGAPRLRLLDAAGAPMDVEHGFDHFA
jgi:thiamine-monophosphate kinase